MISLFFCYSAEDQTFYNELEKQLSIMKHQGLLQSWSAFSTLPGSVVRTDIEQKIADAHIALLLVSPDFLAATHLYEVQLTAIMERQINGSLHVIPVLVRPVQGWKQSKFGHLQALPRDEVPISSWRRREEAYFAIAEELRIVIEKMYNEMPTTQLASSVVTTLAPFLARILQSERENRPSRVQSDNDGLYLRAQQLWQVLRTFANGDLELAGASFLYAAKPEVKEIRDQFQAVLSNFLQQHPAVVEQVRSTLCKQLVVTQHVLADTQSTISTVEQYTHSIQGDLTQTQTVEAHDHSSITGVKQNVNNQRP